MSERKYVRFESSDFFTEYFWEMVRTRCNLMKDEIFIMINPDEDIPLPRHSVLLFTLKGQQVLGKWVGYHCVKDFVEVTGIESMLLRRKEMRDPVELVYAEEAVSPYLMDSVVTITVDEGTYIPYVETKTKKKRDYSAAPIHKRKGKSQCKPGFKGY